MAFMDDDLIYGTLNESDITADGAGSTVYPMYKLTIADISQGSARELMSYQKSGVYITDVSIESYTIYLDRIRIDSEGIITAAEGDTIKNSAGEQNKAVDVAVASDDIKQQVLTLTMTPLEEDESLGKISYDVTNLVLAGDGRNISVASATASTQYYVYVGNTVALATDDLISAITTADEEMGIVLDNTPKYIWKRGRKAYQNSISGIAVGSSDSDASGSARALSAMLVQAG
jgi:hypothetical protein